MLFRSRHCGVAQRFLHLDVVLCTHAAYKDAWFIIGNNVVY